MEITFWGARGSVAVFGQQYKKYGGNTTCLEICLNDNTVIIIDAGTGIRGLGNRLIKNKTSIYHMLVTHTHWDHLQGFPFFAPIFNDKSHIKIYVPHSSHKEFERAFTGQMQKRYFPIPFDKLASKIEFIDTEHKAFRIGSAKIESIRNNHPGLCYSYKITEGKKSFVFMTDNEIFDEKPNTNFEDFVDFIDGAKLLIHDSMYFQREMKNRLGWGHSSVEQVIKLAQASQVERVGLFHHDPERSDSAVDRMVKISKAKLKGKIKIFAVSEKQKIKV